MQETLSDIETLLIERGFSKLNERNFAFTPNVIRITGCTCNGGKKMRLVHSYNGKKKAYLELTDAPNYIKNNFETISEHQV